FRSLVDIGDLAVAFQRVVEVEAGVETSGGKIMAIANPDRATSRLTDPAVDAEKWICDFRILQLQPGGDQHLRQIEETKSQAGVETDAVALAIADVAVGRLDGGICGDIHAIDDVLQVVVRHPAAEYAAVVGQTILQVESGRAPCRER